MPKHTLEYVKSQIESQGWECLSTEYVDSTTILDLLCPNKHKSPKSWNSFNSYVIKQGKTSCHVCSGRIPVTIERANELAKKRNGECLSETASLSSDVLIWKCVHGHVFEANFNKVHQGQWCHCESESRGERICRAAFEQIFGVKFPKNRHAWLPSPDSKEYLELDGYNENLKIAFEHQGGIHYRPVLQQGGKKAHIRTKERDRIKRKKCREKGVILIEIPEVGTVTKIPEVKDFIGEKLKSKGVKLPEGFDELILDLEDAIGGKRPPVNEIIKLYDSGMGQAAIGKIHGLSGTAIKSILVDSGVHVRGPKEASGGIVDPEIIDLAHTYYETGMSYMDVAKKLGLGTQAVISALKETGVGRSHGESQYARWETEPLSEGKSKKVCEYYKAELSIPKCAEHFNISSHQVVKALDEAGIEREREGRKTNVKITEEQELEIVKKYDDGESQKAIRDEYGLGYDHFISILRKYGKNSRRQNKCNLSKTEEKELIKLYKDEKWSLTRIVNEKKVGRINLMRILDEAGIQRHPVTKTVLSSEQEEEVRRLINVEGKTQQWVREKSDLGYDHLKSILHS